MPMAVPEATIDGLGNRTTTVYDSYGREQETIDALGNHTTTVYDAWPRLRHYRRTE